MSIGIAGELVQLARSETCAECAQIVREEWQAAVREFKLAPGTPTEAVTARILGRIATLYPHKGHEK